jgi:hypothetical protein
MSDHYFVLTVLMAATIGCARSSDVHEEPSTPTGLTEAVPDLDAAEHQTAAVTWIFTADLSNARDLGGVALGGSAHTRYDALYRGQALTLSRAGCEEFAALGIRSVVDLRGGLERLFSSDANCVQDSASILWAPLGSTLDYREYISEQESLDSIAATFALLGDPQAYPIYTTARSAATAQASCPRWFWARSALRVQRS